MQQNNSEETPDILPPRRRVLVFIIVALALIMSVIDATIVATALHALTEGLHTTLNWAGWTLTAYAFGLAVMLPITGKLGERYGGRKVFLTSVVIFTITSFCCGLTNNIYILIVLRVLQAAGGAGFTPSATGIIVDHFGDSRDRAVSLFGAMFSTGAMLGPLIGGFLVNYWSWRAVFFVNVPVGILIFLLAVPFIPHDKKREIQSGRADIAGMASMAIFILGGMLAINSLANKGTHVWSIQFLAPAIIAIGSGWFFWRHIRYGDNPFVAPQLIAGEGFGAVNVINAIFAGVLIGSISLVPLYAANRYGMDALRSGSLLTAQGIGTITFTFICVALLHRTGYRRPLYVGGVIIAIGLALVSLSPPAHFTPYVWLACSTLCVGIGSGIINPASRSAGLQLAPQRSATLAALRTLFIQFGSITTVSVVTVILTDSANPGATQSWIFVATAFIMIAAMPIVSRVPEHFGAW